ncbi:AAA domain-containing protein [Clostridium ganghwense]|uniref:AAA domain-containing protein n=1 Tax=Clostridium ganghwense TaxID=312089 RepID=A0ABT4CLT6_9CLOT|nr:AAA domain-containing protein [Clostridium ganghwense]MCY6370009.1 AAA domain-containing protein [Clostridium ganghwense]
MDAKDKLKNVVSYLQSVKNLKYEEDTKDSCEDEKKNYNKKWDIELNNMQQKINEGGFIPETIKALVEDKEIQQSSESLEEWRETYEHLLFPLPYNEEQSEIAKKLAQNFGIVVQGPPGTGKSHTIANLICHLLAHGKRVLVTSQTDKALKVLSEKIPQEIKHLCISMLGNDTEDLKEVDYSIRKITENLALDIGNLDKDRESLQEELIKCRDNQKELYNKLEKVEKIENGNIQYCGKYYKLLNIAKWVKKNENQYSWIEDEIKSVQKCPITDAKFSRLIYLLSNTNKEDIIQFSSIENLLYNIPSCLEITSKMERFLELKNNYGYYKNIIKDWCVSYNVDYDYNRIINLLESTENFLCEIENTWLENILESSCQSETIRIVFQQMLLRCNFYVKKICSIIKEINGHYVEIPENMDIVTLAQSYNIVYKQYEQKGKINKLFRILHPECQSILEKCRVDNKSIENKEQARIAKKYIEQRYVEQSLRKLWNSSMREYEGEEIEEVNLTVLASLEEKMNKIDTLINWDKVVKNKIVVSMRNIAFLSEIDWCNKETYKHLKNGILSIKYLNEYESIKTYITNSEKIISNIKGFEEIAQAIHSNDIRTVRKAYEKLDKFKEIAPKFKEINILLQKINEDCPKLVQRIINDEDKLNMLVKYKNFSIAWRWRQLDNILNKAHEFKFDEIEENIEKEKERESKLIKQIVVKKAWYNQVNKIGESEKRSLYAWLDAVKRIGQGTGKHSGMYKKLAQREMSKCKDIIPIWIMPLNKVIENFTLSNDLFDVVIIDESSQCDIFGISALFRGKKAVIVGDDNQISPEAVGFNMDKIQELIDKHLQNIPHSEWFDMKTSLYNTALRIFPNRIMLKEHFRCVPEIIDFSNNLCYSNEIIPLRQFNSSEKLGFPIKNIKVEGERDKLKPINVKEAEALTNKITECCKEPRYDGMTMGVISLLGDSQSELIENLLRKKIGEREMNEREIICGNAYSFQGDERDIIFLSMVIANNVKFTALTKETDIKRFNVAASRARNQMWIFHSVDLENLNSRCVRSKLLSYCININKNNNKNIDLKNIFESEFQKDVYRMIKKREYEVKPQVVVGNYKIDFVIEGLHNKFAIECNGDKANKIDNWEEEYKKQMCLERVGWKFFKINGSEFYRNPEETMNKLWRKIKNAEINRGIA